MVTPVPREKPRAKERGEFLIGVAFAIVIASAALIGYLRFEERKRLIQMANGEGQALAEFAVGLRGFLAAAQANPALMPAAPLAGVDWLKAPSCGGRAGNPPDGHVPCNFTGGSFGADYRTTFSFDAVTRFAEIRTNFIVPRFGTARDSGATNRNAILLAERLVLSALAGQGEPTNGVFFNAFANVPAHANGPHDATTGLPGGDSGRVVAVVTNAPSHDIYLRTDGTNQMLANLDMGGMSIADARDGRFTGDVRIDQRLEVRGGVSVSGGTADLRGGVITDEVLLTSIGKHVTEGIYDAEVYSGAASYTIQKPDCSAAGNSPGIYAALQSTGTPNDAGYAGDALYEARVDVFDQGASWRVEPIIQTSRFDLDLDERDLVLRKTVAPGAARTARVLVMRRCR